MQLVWEEFLNIIKEEAGTHVVETWFKAVSFQQWDPSTETVFLTMPNTFVSKWIQQNYIPLVKTHLSRLLHANNIKILFACKNENDRDKRTTSPASTVPATSAINKNLPSDGQQSFFPALVKKDALIPRKKSLPSFQRRSRRHDRLKLNKNFTFNSFVVGPTNELAHAAAVAVSQNVGKVYNPLFIYGGTGLGKTHLLHAIGNEIKEKFPTSNIRYETSDSFINEFVAAIKCDKIRLFREKFERTDLLLLDDIQFFSNKEQTQETFFHIFDSLYSLGKQVVFSSDTLPERISGLQNRLQSRLQSGLVADVQMPTLEMKMAILKKKALSLHNMNLDDEVTRFIAQQPTTSIRELEGLLIRLAAISSLSKQPITHDLSQRILHTSKNKQQSVTLSNVAKTVAKYYSVTVGDLKSKKRNQHVVFARQVAFYMMKKYTLNSLQIIGYYLGGKDHTTVLHAIDKIESLVKKDASFEQKLQTIYKTFEY